MQTMSKTPIVLTVSANGEPVVERYYRGWTFAQIEANASIVIEVTNNNHEPQGVDVTVDGRLVRPAVLAAGETLVLSAWEDRSPLYSGKVPLPLLNRQALSKSKNSGVGVIKVALHGGCYLALHYVNSGLEEYLESLASQERAHESEPLLRQAFGRTSVRQLSAMSAHD
jgi:hypothetical protein